MQTSWPRRVRRKDVRRAGDLRGGTGPVGGDVGRSVDRRGLWSSSQGLLELLDMKRNKGKKESWWDHS